MCDSQGIQQLVLGKNTGQRHCQQWNVHTIYSTRNAPTIMTAVEGDHMLCKDRKVIFPEFVMYTDRDFLLSDNHNTVFPPDRYRCQSALVDGFESIFWRQIEGKMESLVKCARSNFQPIRLDFPFWGQLRPICSWCEQKWKSSEMLGLYE